VEFTPSEAKAWAREHYHGLEGCIIPSFTSDLERLDEEAIRFDVDYCARQGLFSILCSIESTSLSQEERKEFVRIVCDEAKGKILVSIAALVDTLERDLEIVRYGEQVGAHHVLLGYPVQLCITNAQELYDVTAGMCRSTSLAIDLYPAARFDLQRVDGSPGDVEVLRRLAEIDNVVAVKVGNGNAPAYTAHVFETVGDQLLVNDPMEYVWAMTVPKYGQQWAGAAGYDHFGTADNQRLVRMFALLRENRLDEAMKIYWETEPIRRAQTKAFSSYAGAGLYPFLFLKYWQYLVGGNGGMLRQPIHRLLEHDRVSYREAVVASGIVPQDGPEEEFYVGRAAYARGERLRRSVAVA
jgi:4-hydroxy-tetrahydrodipicolinate synthase